ncbi:MAG: hypothetical protein FJ026_03225 [Chloroflexi bacterium]|nr:hypothetical protein [Chloroflexota bacterium]
MARIRERKERARLIPDKPQTDLRLATLSVRPLRLAFLVNVQAPKEELLKYIAYNTSIWGGLSNFFIPVRDSTITDSWWDALCRHDSDMVIFCGTTRDQLVADVSEQIQPFHMWEWSDNVAERHNPGFDGFGSAPLRYVLRHIYTQVSPVQQLNIRIPKCADDSPFCFCVAAQFGRLEEHLFDIYNQALKAEIVEFGNGSMKRYLEDISRFEGGLSPLNMTEWGLSSWHDNMGEILGATIVILGDSALAEDFCVFWNLRAAARMWSKGIIALPCDVFDSEDNLRVLGAWCAAHITGTNLLTLVSASIGVEKLIGLRDKLRPFLPEQFLFELWYDQFSFGRFRTHEPESREEVRTTGRTFSLHVPKPSWWQQARSGMEWVVDLDLQDRSRIGAGYIPPRYPKLNHLLAGKPDPRLVPLSRGYSLRSTHERLSLRARKSTEHVTITLPEDERLFHALLVSKGYRPKTTDKCRYARGMISLLGGYEGIKVLQDPRVRELFYAMKDGTAFTPGEMNQLLKPGCKTMQHKEIGSLVAGLALKGIFLRGYQMQCPACDLRRWYSLNEVAGTMRCAGCLAKLQPPIEAPFHYRLNELFVRGIEQGAVPLLLTILMLSQLGSESYLFVPGLEMAKEDKIVDVDILAACNGHLVMVESKDLQGGCIPKVVKELIEQLRNVTRVARDIGAIIVILSALLEESPKELDEAIKNMRQQYPDLAIHLSLRVDLERGYLAAEGTETPARVHDLFPRQPVRESGHISDPGHKFVSF